MDAHTDPQHARKRRRGDDNHSYSIRPAPADSHRPQQELSPQPDEGFRGTQENPFVLEDSPPPQPAARPMPSHTFSTAPASRPGFGVFGLSTSPSHQQPAIAPPGVTYYQQVNPAMHIPPPSYGRYDHPELTTRQRYATPGASHYDQFQNPLNHGMQYSSAPEMQYSSGSPMPNSTAPPMIYPTLPIQYPSLSTTQYPPAPANQDPLGPDIQYHRPPASTYTRKTPPVTQNSQDPEIQYHRAPASTYTGKTPPVTHYPPAPKTQYHRAAPATTYTEGTSADAQVEPILSREQADLVNLMLSGQNVFYTGSAGCGKSTVLNAFVKQLETKHRVVAKVAPTGRAALAINGTTTWSFMGWTPGHHKKPMKEILQGAGQKKVFKRLSEVQIVIFDEISMVENLHFERMNKFMKEVRKSDRPFGGVQVIVTGDFCQLPPVKPFQHCIECGKDLNEIRSSKQYRCKECGRIYFDKDKWAFQSEAWEECNFKHVCLVEIHRQSDRIFINMLQKLRLGIQLADKDKKLLLEHPTDVNANAIRLFGSRAEVDTVNETRFRQLPSKARLYRCADDFWWNEKHYNLNNKGRVDEDGALIEMNDHGRYSPLVKLKKGMAVVLLTNLDIAVGLVNGAQGVVQGFKPYDPAYMPKAASRDANGKPANIGLGKVLAGDHAEFREDMIQRFIDKCDDKVWPEVRFSNGEIRVIQADCTIQEFGDSKPYTRLGRSQVPLVAGYAITTHKSQGMTLDKVIVDLSKTFEPGQAYVALSRARSLQGLKVMSFPPNAQHPADEQVQEFLRRHFPFVFEEFDREAEEARLIQESG